MKGLPSSPIARGVSGVVGLGGRGGCVGVSGVYGLCGTGDSGSDGMRPPPPSTANDTREPPFDESVSFVGGGGVSVIAGEDSVLIDGGGGEGPGPGTARVAVGGVSVAGELSVVNDGSDGNGGVASERTGLRRSGGVASERAGLRRSGIDEGAVRASRSGDAARGVVGRLRARP